MRNSTLILLVVASVFGAANSYAVWGWMRGAAVGEFNDADWEMLKETARSTLDTAADGVQVNWRNDDSGNKGAFKAIMTFRYEDQRCRRLAILNINHKGERGVANYNLCQQTDTTWKFVADNAVTAN